VGKQSLFGYLINKFSNQAEDLATESLNYIINQSIVAKQALLELVFHSTGIKFEDILFQTQVAGADDARPDIVGSDSEGRQVFIIEAKFWAGLTINQPVTYVNRLPKEVNSLLLFLAPAIRIQTLWPELLVRCKEKGVAIEAIIRKKDDFIIGHIDENRSLAITSWRFILDVLFQSLNAAKELEFASDVMQLQGLCEQMDTEAFLPIRSEELSSIHGRRIVQYCHLVNDIVDTLKSEGLAETQGLKATGSLGVYGKYFLLHGFPSFLNFSAEDWSRVRETPLWLKIKGKDWKYSKDVREKLLPLKREEPTRLFRNGDWYCIPLYLKTGVEREQIMEHLLEQIRNVSIYLKE
jgi:hypothetical protein